MLVGIFLIEASPCIAGSMAQLMIDHNQPEGVTNHLLGKDTNSCAQAVGPKNLTGFENLSGLTIKHYLP
jgi:hypothetical protein